MVVQRFASNKSQSLPGWSFPEQLSPWPSPLHHAWNSQRKGGALQTTMSPLLPWSGGFYCQEIPLFRDFIVCILEPALPQPQLHPHPLPANEFKALWKWKVALLHKKRSGEIKWLTLILFGNPSELPSLNTRLACWKGNLFQKHWTELTNSLCM